MEAFVGTTQCGSTQVRTGAAYTIEVVPATSARTGCGTPGVVVRFKISGQDSQQTANFTEGATTTEFTLSAGTATTPRQGHRFLGTVMLNGRPAPVGTVIEARIGIILCGSFTVRQKGFYEMDIANDMVVPGCGTQNNVVKFQVRGVDVRETSLFSRGANTVLNLTAGTAPTPVPTVAATPSGGSVTVCINNRVTVIINGQLVQTPEPVQPCIR